MSTVIFFWGTIFQDVGSMQIYRLTDGSADITFLPSLLMYPRTLFIYQLQFRKKGRFSRMDMPDVSNNTGVLSSHFYLRAQMHLECLLYDVI